MGLFGDKPISVTYEKITGKSLSKKLNELAVTEKSYWCWKKMKSNKARDDYFLSSWDMEKRDLHAYTVAELGEMLPIGYRSYYYDGHPSGGTWMCNDDKILGIADAETEADARAKMLIYLIENKLMEANE